MSTCQRHALPLPNLPARGESQPCGKPPVAPPPRARADVTPRVELQRTRQRRRQAAQPPLRQPQSTPARRAASAQTETAATVSVGPQHVRPPSQGPPQTAHQHVATRRPDRLLGPLLGPSRKILPHLRRAAPHRALAHLATRKQPQTRRVVRGQVGRRLLPAPLGRRLVGARPQCQGQLERHLSWLDWPDWPRRGLQPPAWRRRDQAGRRSFPQPPWRSQRWTPAR
jgi:hypothetical protein